MMRNEGNTDRAVRALAGITLAAIAVVWIGTTTLTGLVVLAVAAVLLVTAAVGFCPLYGLLGINTCPASSSPRRAGADRTL